MTSQPDQDPPQPPHAPRRSTERDAPDVRAMQETARLGLGDVTALLALARDDDATARNRLFDLVYGQLRTRARRLMVGQSMTHTLQPTALVHEAYARLFGREDAVQEFENRQHFFAAAASAMRHTLVDYARYRHRACRDRGREEPLADLDMDRSDLGMPASFEAVLEVDEALKAFAAEYPDFAQVVELKYFAGLTVAEIAAAQKTSKRLAEKRWQFSRAWLLKKLGENPPEHSD